MPEDTSGKIERHKQQMCAKTVKGSTENLVVSGTVEILKSI